MQPSTLGTEDERLSAAVRRGRTQTAKSQRERRAVRKIRFSAAEWRLVEERARACGCAPARFVRDSALDTVPRGSRTRGHAAIIREMGAIAGALRELKRGDSRDGDGAESGINVAVDALVLRLLAVVERLA